MFTLDNHLIPLPTPESADNVDAPGYAVEPSAGSKAGAAFIAANGARIPNRGQMTLSLKSDGGQPIHSTFQVCQTNRPLWSVGKICDAGCKVIFGEPLSLSDLSPPGPLTSYHACVAL